MNFQNTLLFAIALALPPTLAIADTARFDRTFGRWSVFTATDAMTDEAWFGAVAQSGNGDSIQLECHSRTPKTVGILIKTNKFLGSGFRELMYRVDSKPAQSEHAYYGDQHVSLSLPSETQKLILAISSGEKLTVRFNTYKFSSIDISFDIEGAQEATDDLQAKCKSLSNHNADERPASALPDHRSNGNADKSSPPPASAPNGRTLESSLDRLRSQQSQKQSPHGNTPGNSSGEDNALLSGEVRRAIGERLRECWTGDRKAVDFDKQAVRLIVTTDPTGTIRMAEIAPSDPSRNGGGVARAFAERARRAALDPQCAQLPLPGALKGQSRTFEITMRP